MPRESEHAFVQYSSGSQHSAIVLGLYALHVTVSVMTRAPCVVQLRSNSVSNRQYHHVSQPHSSGSSRLICIYTGSSCKVKEVFHRLSVVPHDQSIIDGQPSSSVPACIPLPLYWVFTSPSASIASTCSLASRVCTVPSSNVTLRTAH